MAEYVYGTDGHEGHWLTGEEIVRCRDCKHCRSPQQGFPWMCIRNCCAHFPIEPDGFCSWGERRDV